MSFTALDFWNFSIDIYRLNEIQQTLLDAQNKHSLNVNLALFCLFLNKHNIYLTEEQLSQLNHDLALFNHEFTSRLRELRQSFKANQDKLNSYQEIREALLKTELMLEQQEQTLLVQRFSEFSQLDAGQNDNLQLYQALLSTQNSLNNKSTLNLSDLNQYIR